MLKKLLSLFFIFVLIFLSGCISEGERGRTGAKGDKGDNGVVVYVNCGNITCIMNQTPNQTAGLNGIDGYMSGEDTSTSTPLVTGYYTATNTTGISISNANPSGSVFLTSLMNPYFVVYIWERTV